MISELSEQFANPLDFDNEKIKDLDLLALSNILPLYEKRLKEVQNQSIVLKNEIKKLEQKYNSLEVKMFELKKSGTKFRKIDKELSARESKVLQELREIKVMCPIYEFKMNHFLETFHSKDTSKEFKMPIQWNQKLSQLFEQKQKLQKTIDDNEIIINKFVGNYLI